MPAQLAFTAEQQARLAEIRAEANFICDLLPATAPDDKLADTLRFVADDCRKLSCMIEELAAEVKSTDP